MRSSWPASPTSASSHDPSRNRPQTNMADLSWNPDEQLADDNLRKNFFGSVALHLAIAASIAGLAYFHDRGHSWGESAANAGAIQATMVASLPLPPKQRELDTGVLTSENPSPGPLIPQEKTEPPPMPEAVPIPKKITKPPKVAEKPAPEAPKHP